MPALAMMDFNPSSGTRFENAELLASSDTWACRSSKRFERTGRRQLRRRRRAQEQQRAMAALGPGRERIGRAGQIVAIPANARPRT